MIKVAANVEEFKKFAKNQSCFIRQDADAGNTLLHKAALKNKPQFCMSFVKIIQVTQSYEKYLVMFYVAY